MKDVISDSALAVTEGAEDEKKESVADGGAFKGEKEKTRENSFATEQKNGIDAEQCAAAERGDEANDAPLFAGSDQSERQSGTASGITVKKFLDEYLNCLEEIKSLKSALKSAEDGFSEKMAQGNPDYVRNAAENEEVKKIVIENYLRSVAQGSAPVLLGASVGGAPVTAVTSPKTLKEAKKLAEAFFRR